MIHGYAHFASQILAQNYADKLSPAFGYPNKSTVRYTEVIEHQGRRGVEWLVPIEDVPFWVDESTARASALADFDSASTIVERTNRKTRAQLESEGAFDAE